MRDKPLALVIDDDLLFRKSLEAVLIRLGLEIQATSDAREYLKLSQSLKPDLHLIELRLGDIDGFELLKTLRKSDPRAIIIVITGVTGQFALLHALELGANDFIMKPLDRALLATKLSRYIHTADLAEHESRMIELPDGRAPAKLSIELTITEIDELGIGLKSPHLLGKGTPLKLASEFFRKIGAPDGEVLCTVVSTTYDHSTGLYGAYAEPIDSTGGFLEAVRRWLVQTQRKSSSQNS